MWRHSFPRDTERRNGVSRDLGVALRTRASAPHGRGRPHKDEGVAPHGRGRRPTRTRASAPHGRGRRPTRTRASAPHGRGRPPQGRGRPPHRDEGFRPTGTRASAPQGRGLPPQTDEGVRPTMRRHSVKAVLLTAGTFRAASQRGRQRVCHGLGTALVSYRVGHSISRLKRGQKRSLESESGVALVLILGGREDSDVFAEPIPQFIEGELLVEEFRRKIEP
jgi:hypothetical protein